MIYVSFLKLFENSFLAFPGKLPERCPKMGQLNLNSYYEHLQKELQ